MIILEAVKAFFKKCPLINNGIIRAEYLAEKPGEGYTIEVLPGDPIIKEYIDGSSERQLIFAFGSREYYGEDDLENISNSGFYEDLSSWMEEKNMLDDLPDIGKKRVVRSIEALTPGYLYNNERNSARYQIQCRLKYFQEAV